MIQDNVHRKIITTPSHLRVGTKYTAVVTAHDFDLFHRGHVELLRRAKAFGDLLVVGVYQDRLLSRAPIFSIEDRLLLVASTVYADKVVLVDDLAKLLKRVKPSFYINWAPLSEEIVSLVEDWGGRCIAIPPVVSVSTTDILWTCYKQVEKVVSGETFDNFSS